MSMPTFPVISPDITCDHALNMILASIAMEEIALSHIMNAEGEKLQYVLGTLNSSKCKEQPTIDEILAVNQSITDLLDSVSQNQMLLKNKMDKALHALSNICPKSIESDCKCPSKCSVVFRSPACEVKWHAGCMLPWEIEDWHRKCACCVPYDKTRIELRMKKRFMVSFAVNVMTRMCCECIVAISLQMSNEEQRKDIFTFHGHLSCTSKISTISMNNIIVDTTKGCGPFLLSLSLISPDLLTVEDAMLSIVEI